MPFLTGDVVDEAESRGLAQEPVVSGCASAPTCGAESGRACNVYAESELVIAVAWTRSETPTLTVEAPLLVGGAESVVCFEVDAVCCRVLDKGEPGFSGIRLQIQRAGFVRARYTADTDNYAGTLVVSYPRLSLDGAETEPNR